MTTESTKQEQELLMEFDFNLVIDVEEITDELEEKLFEAGCDDAVLVSQDCVVRLCFIREAKTLLDAVVSAWSDIKKAGFHVLRSDFCNLVNQSEIAARVGCSRQVINQYAHGRRLGNFPSPVCYISDDSPLWSWCEVAAWLYEQGIISDQLRQKAFVLDVFNNLLECCKNRLDFPEIVKVFTANMNAEDCGCTSI